MKEPAPTRLAPPNGTRPALRIAVALPEDRLETIVVEAPDSPRCWRSGNTSIAFSPDILYCVEARGDRVCLRAGGSESLGTFDCLTLEPNAPATLHPRSGVLLHGLMVGRQFHWRKKADLSFEGSLSFYARQGCLLAVNEIDFESYATCVIASEMGASCPSQFLRAQAAAARSWAYVFLRGKHDSPLYDVCNDDCCQRYQGTTFLKEDTVRGIAPHAGEFLCVQDGSAGCAVVPAYYSKNCGGHSEHARHAFGFDAAGISAVLDGPSGAVGKISPSPISSWIGASEAAYASLYCHHQHVSAHDLRIYLGGVDELGAYFRWHVEVSREELSATVAHKLANRLDGETSIVLEDMKVLSRGVSGRITSLELHLRNSRGQRRSLLLASQMEIRQALHPSFLLSSAFVHRWQGDDLRIDGAGWGHGVGMCQMGALTMALQGSNAEDILLHYFPQCEIVRGYS